MTVDIPAGALAAERALELTVAPGPVLQVLPDVELALHELLPRRHAVQHPLAGVLRAAVRDLRVTRRGMI